MVPGERWLDRGHGDQLYARPSGARAAAGLDLDRSRNPQHRMLSYAFRADGSRWVDVLRGLLELTTAIAMRSV